MNAGGVAVAALVIGLAAPAVAHEFDATIVAPFTIEPVQALREAFTKSAGGIGWAADY